MDIIKTVFRQRGPEIFQHLERYAYKGFLGEGSFGAVYKAQHRRDRDLVAVKVNKTEPAPHESKSAWKKRLAANIADFEAEYDTLQVIKDTPHCLSLIAFYELKFEFRRVIITELCDGTLHDLMRDRKITEKMLFRCWRHMLKALVHIADLKLAHRDIHYGNIFYKTDPDSGKLSFVLGDWGLCVPIGTADGRAGAPPFRAPEVLNGEPTTRRSDVYSLFTTISAAAGIVTLDQRKSGDENVRAMREAVRRHPIGVGWTDAVSVDWRARAAPRDLLRRVEAWKAFRAPEVRDESPPQPRFREPVMPDLGRLMIDMGAAVVMRRRERRDTDLDWQMPPLMARAARRMTIQVGAPQAPPVRRRASVSQGQRRPERQPNVDEYGMPLMPMPRPAGGRRQTVSQNARGALFF